MSTIDVAAVVDRSRIGAFQVRLFVLCALSLIMDGFDVQVIGFLAPEITRDWQVTSAALAPVFAAGNLGVLLGAMVFTMAADRLGRRPVLIGSTFFFAVMMLVTARATSLQELTILRFITGLGLGSVVPSATALIGEYSPARSRVALMMSITVGFTAGAAFGGLIAGWLIPLYGWRSVLYFGGAVPLVIAAGMWFWLPESLQLLVMRGRTETAKAHLARIDPSVDLRAATLVVPEPKGSAVPAADLFRSGRAAGTLLLWFVNFMNILLIYSLGSWLPTVVRDAGHSRETAVLVGTILQVGGTIGTLVFAQLVGRFTFVPVLLSSFVLALLSLASIGPSLPAAALLTGVVFIAGWCTIGAQPALNAFSATFYPTSLRSTGVGWALGIGRLGAIVGPIIGGELMRRQWPGEQLFYAAAVPAALAVVGTLLLGRVVTLRLPGASS